MQFEINSAIAILERTPLVVETLLTGLPDEWVLQNEGENTWSPFDVVGHLIHGEKTDWIPRMQIILNEDPDKRFTPFDRFAQFQDSARKTMPQLIHEFKTLRNKNLEILKATDFNEDILNRKGIHPEFGEVTLKQLLATWVLHDLSHLSQITRVMAKQYCAEIGPWTKYFSMFNK